MAPRSSALSLAVVAAALSFAEPVAGCGVVVHGEISRRARLTMNLSSSLETILNKYSGAVDAGAPFPDYLYACGKNHSAGEYAHWHQFHRNFVKYIQEQHPQWADSDEHGAKLVAFLMGVASHYIADINWHGLGQTQSGFINQVGLVDRGCGGDLCEDAHDTCDTGAEFMIAKQMSLSNYGPTEWWVPVDDIVKVFALGEYLVEASWIKECALLFAAEVEGIKAAPLAWRHFSEKSEMLQESLEDFFLGGLDDNAAWSAIVWSEVADWLAGKGTAPTLENAVQRTIREKRLQSYKYLESAAPPSNHRETEDGALEIPFRTKAPLQAEDGEQSAADADDTLGYQGTSLALCDVDQDGHEDLIVGSPGIRSRGSPLLGMVEVTFGGPAYPSRSSKIFGQKILSRFGSSLVCEDGLLLVGAPSEGPWGVRVNEKDPDWNFENQTYYGAVHAYRWNGAALATVWSWQGDQVYGNCGATAAAAGDAFFVGCPFGVNEGPTPVSAGRVVALSKSDGTLLWSVTGTAIGAKFGSALAPIENSSLLAVGAPGERANGTTMSSGSVSFLEQATGNILYKISPNETKTRFGQSLVANKDTLWVGVPGDNQTELMKDLHFPYAGRADQFKITVDGSSNLTVTKGRSITAQTRSEFAFFGSTLSIVRAGSHPATLVVGAPGEDEERGLIEYFNAESGSRLATKNGPKASGRFGTAMASSSTTGRLVVSAPKASTTSGGIVGDGRQGIVQDVAVPKPLVNFVI